MLSLNVPNVCILFEYVCLVCFVYLCKNFNKYIVEKKLRLGGVLAALQRTDARNRNSVLLFRVNSGTLSLLQVTHPPWLVPPTKMWQTA